MRVVLDSLESFNQIEERLYGNGEFVYEREVTGKLGMHHRMKIISVLLILDCGT